MENGKPSKWLIAVLGLQAVIIGMLWWDSSLSSELLRRSGELALDARNASDGVYRIRREGVSCQ